MMIMAQCSEAIVEFTHRFIVDVNNNDYAAATSENPNLHNKSFVLILEEPAWLMVETAGGQIGRFYFPVGDCTHLRKIFAHVDNSITTGINIGY